MPFKDKEKMREYMKIYAPIYRKRFKSNDLVDKRFKHTFKRKQGKSWNQSLRVEILLKFGNKCIRCGFTDWRALQVDHVNGGGSKDYRMNKGTFYLRVLKDNNNQYQLLCANCNWIKRWESKE